jgi:hypothetical protein
MYLLLKSTLLLLFYQLVLMAGDMNRGDISRVSRTGVNSPVDIKNTKANLFFIRRNTDKNLVIYEANLLGKSLNPKKPVHIYWVRHTEGGIIKELNFMQRKLAYGLDLKKGSDGNSIYEGTIAAYEKRVIRITLNKEGKPMALVIINGKWQQLQNIYLHISDPDALIPKIAYLQLFGKDLQTGATVSEKVIP